MKLPSRTAMIRLFRVLAVAEAFSWAALLTGMFLKWVIRTTELGVEIAGPVHGAFFLAYGAAALAVWRLQRWPFRVAFLAGLSAVFPFATVLFERWAGKRGYLTSAAEAPGGAAAGAAALPRAGADAAASGAGTSPAPEDARV